MSRTGWVLVIIAVVVIAMQFFRPAFSNPVEDPHQTMQAVVAVPPDVQSIFERSCYDCHSSRTVLPWYSKVAPVSWLLASDINEGREEISFSTFASMSRKRASKKFTRICDEVKHGDMPPWYYLPMHPAAKLSDADRTAICNWTVSAQQQFAAAH